MDIPIKPKPNEKYLSLGARDAQKVAMAVAKRYSPDTEPDWSIFREFTQAHLKYAKSAIAKL